MNILGISAYYHDSAACLLVDGTIIAAAQEERFTRKKHDPSFPTNAIQYCLKEAGLRCAQIDEVVYYEKPFLKFERLLESYLAFAPRGFSSFVTSMPIWLKEKLFLKRTIREELNRIDESSYSGSLLFTEHHEAHAASAFYCSPFEQAAILTMDGVGEWTTTSLGIGKGNELSFLKEIQFPHSLGLLYSAFTYYTGFKVNSGEYKVMGLAPYGNPRYVQKIKDHLIDIKDDGSFRMNMDFFDYCTGFTMTNERFHRLFGGPPRIAESQLTQKEMDLAASIQVVTEEIVLKIATSLQKETGMDALCMAGGVALNCVANGKILEKGIFKHVWIQPASGDAGGAIGAALSVWHRLHDQPRKVSTQQDSMMGAYLGPNFSDNEIKSFLDQQGIPYDYFSETPKMLKVLSQHLSEDKVMGWFQGRMEFGPRALGNRSIIGDARSSKMQSTMNLKIKFRESFRPFAPSVLRERLSNFFQMDDDSPYMLLVAPVIEKRRIPMTVEQQKLWGIDQLNVPRSDIPAVTHVDYSARIQTVHHDTNPIYWDLIKAFEDQTGYGVIVNTSFNVRGEPIVCSPADAYRCFMRTGMDFLVLGNFLLDKKQMPKDESDDAWKSEFTLD